MQASLRGKINATAGSMSASHGGNLRIFYKDVIQNHGKGMKRQKNIGALNHFGTFQY